MKNLIGAFFSFIGKALSETPEEPSAMRVNVFYSVVLLVPCIAFALVYVVVFYPDQLQAVLNAVLLFVGALFGAKIWQKSKEQ